ncbi:DUF427 domain-containing protein [Granulosicoccus antarcticus]|uniref:DUF427 domain-containing protein n=1 Tax=Granulosicoccus antarcticus IMCC3135 TaxID=1192854 RepID=A0A2Z2NZB7_9GAMM|nr:DUF427 domain-containing protein [Granulosicoccus antarcticus]ASJ75128.1 hypothetical protein IMCC3135_25325 [Granulosicoccus antarcticus IMCC3135]
MTIRMRESYRVIVADRYLSTRFIDDVVEVLWGNHVVIETDYALRLLEGDRTPVTYVPINEITGATLQVSDTAYNCRWKGAARYYDVHLSNGEVVLDGAWAYPEAPDELALLRKQIAFDTEQFSEIFTSKRGGVNEQIG